MLGVSVVVPHVALVRTGYQLEAAKSERQTLLDQRRALEVREAALLSPSRLNDIAKEQNLTAPMSGQDFHLDGQMAPQHGNLASNQKPAVPGRLQEISLVEVRDRSEAANHRLVFLAVILFLWAIAIVARLFVLQVVEHDKYVEIARRQQEEQIAIHAPRGTILDRNGQALAISLPVTALSVNPRQITDAEMASELLSSSLGMDQQTLYAKLTNAQKNHKGFLWIRHDLDPFATERLRNLHLAYATFHNESEREYPGGETAAHVLGGLGVIKKDGPQVQGVMGIERGMNKVLHGEDGEESILMDVHHKGIDSRVDAVEKPGTQLTLSIDARLQYDAAREHTAGVIANHARSRSRNHASQAGIHDRYRQWHPQAARTYRPRIARRLRHNQHGGRAREI